MAFDDLARHMASRDGRKQTHLGAANAAEIMANAQAEDRRMQRTRDLVLGPLLVVGGLGVAALALQLRADDMTGWMAVFCASALSAIGFGARQTLRGLRA